MVVARSATATAVDMPVRWIVGTVAASAALSIPVAVATVRAGIALYERRCWRVETYRPPQATAATPVPYSGHTAADPRR